MEFKKINGKKIIYIILSGFIIVSISGCSKTNSSLSNSYIQGKKILHESKKENLDNSYNQNNEIIIEPNDPIKNNTTDTSNEDVKDKKNKYIEIQDNISKYSSNDEFVIRTFNNINDEIDTILNNNDIENVKKTVKGTFITIIDFVFYGSEINGITFDKLTDSGKKKVLEIANKIDVKIEKKFHNYKENISKTAKKAFNKASELIKKGANDLNEFSKEKLGKENYTAIITAKDEFINYTKQAFDIIGDIGSNVFNNGKEYIKNWYVNLKRD